jgi:hypothetical protein
MASTSVERIPHYHALLGSDQFSACRSSACGR